MDAPRKPREESKLKNLPPDRQAMIVDYMEGKGDQPGHSLAETASWLAADGVETSVKALSLFRSWYLDKGMFEQRETRIMAQLERYKARNPKMTPDALFEMGQFLFNGLAITEEDSKTWYLTQQIGLKKQQLSLDREKVEILTCEKFIAWFADRKARDIAESNLSNADKIARLRQTYFADIEEMEKSGEVQLPQ